MSWSRPKHGTDHTSTRRTKVSAKEKARPNRQKDILVAAAAIIVIVAAAVATYAYSLNNDSSRPGSSITFVTGTLGPPSVAKNFTNIFFTSTTTLITYSAPINNSAAYGRYLYSGMKYNVTIEIFTTSGNSYCVTTPQSINVSGARQEEDFNCSYYV